MLRTVEVKITVRLEIFVTFSGSHFLHFLHNIDKNHTSVCFAFVKSHVSVGLIIYVVNITINEPDAIDAWPENNPI